MDRRAVAQRNRKPQVNNEVQDKPRHAVATKIQNGYQSEQQQQNPFKTSPVNPFKENNNAASPAFPTGECTKCRGKSVCVCQRCGDWYCSPQCQDIDWTAHRYICFPKPQLVFPEAQFTTDDVFPLQKSVMVTVNGLDDRQKILNDLNQQLQYHLRQQRFELLNNNNKGGANKTPNKKESTATLPQANLPKTNSRVILTGFRTPNRCYVRPLSDAEDEDYLLNARKIDSYGKTAQPLNKLPKAHSYAIAPHDGAMYRVEILTARNPDNVRVLFLDRGIIATRRLNQLREISDEIILLKQYACMIPLRNVSNYVLNGDMTKYFATFEDLQFKIKYDRIEDGVELLHWQNERSLNDEIEKYCKDTGGEVWADTVRSKQAENTDKYKNNNSKAGGNRDNPEGIINNNKSSPNKVATTTTAVTNGAGGDEHDEQYYAKSNTSSTAANVKEENASSAAVEKKVDKVEEVQGPTMIAPFETHYFKVGCAPFKAIVLDVSCLDVGYIGCIAQDDLPCLQTVHKQLSAIDVPNKPYKPKLDEYCIAKFEDMWYRAQVTDIPDKSHYTVTYIDFTNEATLTSDEIRHYPASVTGVCKTNLCLIGGLPSDFSAELIKFLGEEINLQTNLTIDGVIKIDEQVVIIECKSLLAKMQKKNLLA